MKFFFQIQKTKEPKFVFFQKFIWVCSEFEDVSNAIKSYFFRQVFHKLVFCTFLMYLRCPRRCQTPEPQTVLETSDPGLQHTNYLPEKIATGRSWLYSNFFWRLTGPLLRPRCRPWIALSPLSKLGPGLSSAVKVIQIRHGGVEYGSLKVFAGTSRRFIPEIIHGCVLLFITILFMRSQGAYFAKIYCYTIFPSFAMKQYVWNRHFLPSFICFYYCLYD